MFNSNISFYPTPKKLIDKMTSSIKFESIGSVLEPSAGKGNIAEEVAQRMKYAQSRYKDTIKDFDIDCIELDENLTHILKGKGLKVIHDDFLTLNTYKKYDLIILNPPFQDGEKHLLKAIDVQKNGGKIVCILNAETIKNPYSVTRKDLIQKLEDHNAKIEYIQDSFIDAERKTNVEITLINIDIPTCNRRNIILDQLKQDEKLRLLNEKKINNGNSLINGDYIKGIVEQYNYEGKAGIQLINEFASLKPLTLSKFDGNESILELSLVSNRYNKNGDNDNLQNDYIKQLRSKYWKALFTSEQFTKLLTTDLRSQYMNKVSELENYDFSYYNIKQIQVDISKSMIQSLEDEILKLFDEFSHQHSYYGETCKNIHLYNGWKTNKSWVINKKIIIPLSGYIDRSYSWGYYDPSNRNVIDKLRDIEKVFNYLDGGLTKDVEIERELKNAKLYEQSKNLKLKYFDITFYKKGTCHITFKNEELLKKFNIFGSQRKGWLPPNYSKSDYTNMSKEEQQVVDNFQGKDDYENVYKNLDYYIAKTEKMLLLNEKSA